VQEAMGDGGDQVAGESVVKKQLGWSVWSGCQRAARADMLVSVRRRLPVSVNYLCSRNADSCSLYKI
jgi:hypothetical protein